MKIFKKSATKREFLLNELNLRVFINIINAFFGNFALTISLKVFRVILSVFFKDCKISKPPKWLGCPRIKGFTVKQSVSALLRRGNSH